jgi:hypothetical protein
MALWWTDLSEAVPRKKRKDVNALVTLVSRSLWLERNNMIFDKFANMPMEVCKKIKAEFQQWKRAHLCVSVGEIE